ncbi:trypsin delta-like [Schistocerca gregaria]|uniref:trypsin delta-like n=1 Tax=Schistocerca gregaria TaxID=7010 RepID=UPI00211F3CAD|nr:trypsin delta-like [Schistocerca gregaria]
MLKLGLALCALAAVCSAAPSPTGPWFGSRPGPRIVGGEPVDISQYPWQISLQVLGFHGCGGSIISSTWVLTAAHCVDSLPVVLFSVRAGTSTRESGGTVYDAANYVEHDGFSFATADFDIAVVQISGSFSFDSNVQAVSLGTSEPAAGTAVTITGWGDLSEGGTSPRQLQAVTTNIVSRDSCNASYGGEITERMICAGDPQGGKDACQGDSGGPLVVDSTQYGVVSWGNGCANASYPGVYSNVAALRSWITENSGV